MQQQSGPLSRSRAGDDADTIMERSSVASLGFPSSTLLPFLVWGLLIMSPYYDHIVEKEGTLMIKDLLETLDIEHENPMLLFSFPPGS